MTIELALIKPSDIEAVQSFLDSEKVPKEQDYFQKCYDLQNQGDREVYLFMKEGAPLGYGQLNFNPKYQFYQRLDVPEIQDIYVARDRRGQGIATEFIKFCEDRARERGYDHLGISVALTKNYGPAQRLYAKLGYMPDGNGVTYDRKPVCHAQSFPVDDDLCLMLIKAL